MMQIIYNTQYIYIYIFKWNSNIQMVLRQQNSARRDVSKVILWE